MGLVWIEVRVDIRESLCIMNVTARIRKNKLRGEIRKICLGEIGVERNRRNGLVKKAVDGCS